jgi:hypothetical protein
MGIWSETTQDLDHGFTSFASCHVRASAARTSPRVGGGGEFCCGYQLAEPHPAWSPRGADVSSSARRANAIGVVSDVSTVGALQHCDAGVVIDGDHPQGHGCQDLAHDVLVCRKA